jgi:hypothetical protein
VPAQPAAVANVTDGDNLPGHKYEILIADGAVERFNATIAQCWPRSIG